MRMSFRGVLCKDVLEIGLMGETDRLRGRAPLLVAPPVLVLGGCGCVISVGTRWLLLRLVAGADVTIRLPSLACISPGFPPLPVSVLLPVKASKVLPVALGGVTGDVS